MKRNLALLSFVLLLTAVFSASFVHEEEGDHGTPIRLFTGTISDRSSGTIKSVLEKNGIRTTGQHPLFVLPSERSRALAILARNGLPEDGTFSLYDTGSDDFPHSGPYWSSKKLSLPEVQAMENEIRDFVVKIPGVSSGQVLFDPERTKEKAAFFGDSRRKILFIVYSGSLDSSTTHGIVTLSALINRYDIKPDQISVQQSN